MIGKLKYWLCMLFYMSTHHNLQIVTFEWKLQLSYNTVDVTCCKQMRYFSGFIVSFSGYWQSRCSITLTDARTFLGLHEDGLNFKSPRASAPIVKQHVLSFFEVRLQPVSRAIHHAWMTSLSNTKLLFLHWKSVA